MLKLINVNVRRWFWGLLWSLGLGLLASPWFPAIDRLVVDPIVLKLAYNLPASTSVIVLAQICSVLLGWCIYRIGGFRVTDLMLLDRCPAIWLFGLLGCFAFAAPTCTSQELSDLYLLLGFFIGGAAVPDSLRRIRDSRKRVETRRIQMQEDPLQISNDADFFTWLHSETPIKAPNQSIFPQHNRIAKRIARRARAGEIRGMGLIGEFGSGKSSILNLVEYHLNESKDNLLVCRIGGWGLTDETVAEFVLTQIVRTISRQIDCFGLILIPKQYRNALAHSASGWSRVGHALGAAADATGIINRIQTSLELAGVRLLLVIEDLDRNTSRDIFAQQLAPLLDRLHHLETVTTVVAIGQADKTDDILSRFCERTEPVSRLDKRDTQELITHFMRLWRGQYPEDVYLGDRSHALKQMQLEALADSVGAQSLRVYDHYEQAASIISTPRVLKAVIGRVDEAWSVLHGEVDLDELFVLTLLKHAVPDAYRFMADRHGEISTFKVYSQSLDREEGSQRIRDEWMANSTRSETDSTAILSLICFLFPALASKTEAWWVGRAESCQNVSESDEYWERINAEDPNTSTYSDQQILSGIAAAIKKDPPPHLGNYSLGEALARYPELGQKIEQFKVLLDGDAIRNVAADLITAVLACPDIWVEREPYGLISLWRISHEKRVNDHGTWVIEQIARSLPSSFRLANCLYYYWGDDNHPGGSRTAPEVRAAMVCEARRLFAGEPRALISSIDPEFPYSMYHFAVSYDKPDKGGLDFVPNKWQWLANTLLDAALIDPETIVPQICCLVVDGGEGFGIDSFKFRLDYVQGMFSPRIGDLVAALSTTVEAKGIHPDFIKRIKFARREAKQLLTSS